MARSHVVVALGTAFFTALLVSQLVVNFGFPQVDFWHWRLDEQDVPQTHMFSEKQDNGTAEAPSQYLIGAGKADITGYDSCQPIPSIIC